ncbi:MAG: M48 family metallopeptidase [Candidatus Omnitrophica bacterium]|nr:M48 family metallopeptidase [Candidatus Omnitrophota bacterium]
MNSQVKEDTLGKAKEYSSLKYALVIIDTIYLLVLLFVFVGLGFSKNLALFVLSLSANNYFVIPAYLFLLSVIYLFFSFPLNFYGSYYVEHKFNLSNQKLSNWFIDQLKSFILSYIIGLVLLSAFYFILNRFQQNWWLVISLFWILFSLILAKLTPTIIIPLFFKYKKLSDESLRERIMNLAKKMGVSLLDCFEIDLSSKSLKANAAFVGLGRSRRVLLADTLKDKYSQEEIEVILAHEFAHYKLKHLTKLIIVNSLATFLVFYLIFITNHFVLNLFGFDSLSQISALPIVFIYFVLFGVISQPLTCFYSRVLEREADKLALKTTGMKEAFISTMDKLATQNLADRNPHPIIKFFFFDHPPIDERIKLAK